MTREAVRATMTREEWNKHALEHNTEIAHEIMEDWGCSELEAWASIQFDTASLEETQDIIAQMVTYDRLMKRLPTECARFLRDEYYKYKPEAKDEEFIKSEARNMAEEQAWMFVYEWKQFDEYEDVTEEEKETVVFG